MTDTPNAPALVERMMEYPSRLQMSMLAPVKAIAAAIPEGDKEVRIVGYVMGEARGISYRNNPNDTDGLPAEALIGVFNGIPSFAPFPGMDPAAGSEHRAELASGVCFLPPQAQATIVAKVRGPDASIPETPKRGKRIDQLGVVVPIAFEIGIRKSGSPVGYEWVTRGIARVQAMSPIDRMRQAMGLKADANMAGLIADGTLQRIVDKNDAAPQIEGPKTVAQAAPVQPAKAPPKSSRKR